jgi:hypothetical protein
MPHPQTLMLAFLASACYQGADWAIETLNECLMWGRED